MTKALTHGQRSPVRASALSALAFVVMLLGLRPAASPVEPGSTPPIPIAGIVLGALAIHVASGLGAMVGVCRLGPEQLLGLVFMCCPVGRCLTTHGAFNSTTWTCSPATRA